MIRSVLATMLAASCLAAAAPCLGETVRARAAPDGATLVLTDGRELALVGLLVPPAGLRFPSQAAQRIGQRAADTLSSLAVGQVLEIDVAGRTADRYGRLPAEVHDARGRLLQALLLAQGLARFDPGSSPPRESGAMYTAERAARDHHRGLWADRSFAVRRPDDLARSVDDFAIVSGIVARVERAGSRTLVRFGSDARRDATLTIDGAARARFKQLGYDLQALVGTRIRARGWVERQPAVGGLAIAIEQPLQIERLLGTGELY